MWPPPPAAAPPPAPSPEPTPAETAPPAANAEASPPPAAAAAAPAPVTAATPPPEYLDEAPRPEPRMRNKGMFVGGIVLTSLAPVVFLAGLGSWRCNGSDSGCDEEQRTLAVGLVSLALLGVGIPMIVSGGRRVPAAQLTVAPVLAPRHAGLQLRLSL